MAIKFGDIDGGGNGVLPPGVVPPVIVPPVPGSSFFNSANVNDGAVNKQNGGGHLGQEIVARQGDIIELFDQFWFNHIHLIPQRFDLGNVLATSPRDYELFNGHKDAVKEVNLITEAGFDGISITSGPTVPPFNVLQKQSIDFEVTVSTIGPPNISASIQYDFTSSEELILFLTGTRIVVAPLEPSFDVNEIYTFKTDVQTGIDGTEQRTALRDLPRLSYTMPYRAVELVMQFAENQFYEWAARLWAIPVWTDLTDTTSDVAALDTTINVVSTDDRDFRAGSGELGIIYDNFENFEAFEIATVNATSLVLAQPIQGAFSVGAAVMPVRFAYLRGPLRTQPWVVNLRDMNFQWDVLESIDWGDSFAGLPTTYKSLPFFDQLLEMNGLQYPRSFDKRFQRVDSEIGLFDQFITQSYPVVMEGAQFNPESRTAVADLKRLLMSFRGKQKVAWFETHRDDFQIEQDLLAGQDLMRVKITNYTLFLNDDKRTRADIIVRYIDGGFDLREILSATLIPGSHEELQVDTSFSQDVSAANVDRISFVVKRRLDVDELKFTWTGEGRANIAIALLDVLS